MISNSNSTNNVFQEVARLIRDIALQASSKFDRYLIREVFGVYLAHELREHGHRVLSNAVVPIYYEDLIIKQGFPMDLVVNDVILVQLIGGNEKKAKQHRSRFQKQLLLTGSPCGILVQFDNGPIPKVMHLLPALTENPSYCA